MLRTLYESFGHDQKQTGSQIKILSPYCTAVDLIHCINTWNQWEFLRITAYHLRSLGEHLHMLENARQIMQMTGRTVVSPDVPATLTGKTMLNQVFYTNKTQAFCLCIALKTKARMKKLSGKTKMYTKCQTGNLLWKNAAVKRNEVFGFWRHLEKKKVKSQLTNMTQVWR